MGIPVLILGESGSGKSASMRNFTKDDVGVLNVASKPLPFRSELQKLDGATYIRIAKALDNGSFKSYVIDDSQYLMCFEMFNRATETGYTKFTEIAKNFYEMIQYIINKTPNDCIVYLLHHIEQTDFGRIKAKTSGKMLDNQLTLEGLFSIVLLARTDGQRYWFETKTDGGTPVKTPIGMFNDSEIDNDLKAVDTVIREYYGLNKETEIKKDEQRN